MTAMDRDSTGLRGARLVDDVPASLRLMMPGTAGGFRCWRRDLRDVMDRMALTPRRNFMNNPTS